VKLRAVILDWAGTVVDHGSRAPVAALQSVFEPAGVPITIAEARESMGLAKRTHIRAILEIPRVRAAWISKHGAEPSEQDADQLYAQFIPNQMGVLADHSSLILGVGDAVRRMRSRGLKIGTTTGYNRAMLDYLLERAAAQGFEPDCALCPEEAGAGRPLPWMCYMAAMRLGVYPMSALVKIGDTPADIAEGRNAGMWTIGVTRTGNEIGVTEEEWAGLGGAEREKLLEPAERRLLDAGAHFTVESVAGCDWILDKLGQVCDLPGGQAGGLSH
jgi:phosphonoacetaldehyde hydrolase